MPLPEPLLATLAIRIFGITRIPLIAFVRPRIHAVNRQRAALTIPLRRRTRNHLRSMYFGSLAIGAELVAGMYVMRLIKDSGEKISLVFKEFDAQFLRRAEGDVLFECTETEKMYHLVQQAIQSGERIEETFEVHATVPSIDPDEVVARFRLTISLKKR
jgi:acyl-coenzyme A thioesterase PaaI-like protein